MTAAARIAAASRRVAQSLARRGRTVPAAAQPAPTWHLHPTVCRALEAATIHERPGADEGHPRIVISIPGHPPFLAGDEDETAEAIRKCFPKELPALADGRIGARFLADAQRQRVRERKRAAKRRNFGGAFTFGDLA